jgi:hypothetical protein
MKNIVLEHYIKLLKEYEDDINYDYYEDYNNKVYDIFNDIASNKKIEFVGKIDPKQYHTALKKFIKMGDISNFPEKKILDWKDMIIDHIWMLSILTEINGHSSSFPTDEFMDVFNNEDDQQFTNWVAEKNKEAGKKLYSSSGRDWESIMAFLDEEYNFEELSPTFSNGQFLVSDYGLKPLLTLAYELYNLTHPNEILVCINKILDVSHQRSDLAELFVYGGSKELDFIHDYIGNVNEKWYGQNIKTKFGKIYQFDVFVNPSKKELMEMNGICRGIVVPSGDIYTVENMVHYDLLQYLIENKIINDDDNHFDKQYYINTVYTNLLFLQNIARNNIYDFYLSESYSPLWKKTANIDKMEKLRDKCLEKNPMFNIKLISVRD